MAGGRWPVVYGEGDRQDAGLIGTVFLFFVGRRRKSIFGSQIPGSGLFPRRVVQLEFGKRLRRPNISRLRESARRHFQLQTGRAG